MTKDYQTLQIARFSLNTKFRDVGTDNIEQLKRHLLDAIGSMVYASARPIIQKLLNQYKIMGDGGRCKVPLIKSLPYDRAGQLFTALIRYPDFMDNFLGKEATCHPSDNIGSLLAISQYKPISGKDFLTAMAVAYQIECRLIQEIPVMKKGIDHTVLLAYSLVAAIARIIGLTEEQAAHALGMAGCSINSLVTSRASYTYEWKGIASSLDALDCINIALLAGQGMTGPISIFEGPKGVKDIFDMDLEYDWSRETFELIHKCILKKYNAEAHSQSVLEAALFLKNKYGFDATDIEKIDITSFLTAYHIIGSGAYGDRKKVFSKEQADHSLHYLTAVALLDGEVYPAQFEPERINRTDVQELLQKVSVHTGFPLHKPVAIAGMLDPYTQAYPDKVKAKVEITLRKGASLVHEIEDYPGFFTKPFTWHDTITKFRRLCAGTISEDLQDELISVVSDLDQEDSMAGLIELLSSIGVEQNQAKLTA